MSPRSLARAAGAALAVVIAVAQGSVALAAAGDLDGNFDGDGKVTTSFPGFAYASGGVATAPGNKLVAAGFYQVASGNNDFAIARYLPDGTPDTAFDADGKATLAFTVGDDEGVEVAVQDDGKVVVAGYAAGNNIAVARFTTGGIPDSTFSGDGKVTTDFGGTDIGTGVAIQDDGKVVVGGYTSTGGGTMVVVRYTSSGVPDGTFSGDGKLPVDIPGAGDRAWDIAIQGDGKIVLAGDTGGGNDVALARVTGAGVPDGTFSGDGKQVTDFGSSSDRANGVTLQGNGRIVAAGLTNTNATRTFDFAVARYTTTGALDTSFSGDGKLKTNFGEAEHAFATVVQPDGKIVVVGDSGTVAPGGQYVFAVARYQSGGGLDDTFSGDGKVKTDFDLGPSGWDAAYGVTLQGNNNKIVAAGRSSGTFGLARYLSA